MANPSLVTLTASNWSIVATAITNADIYIKAHSPNVYAWTYVLHGGAAPTDQTESIAVRDQHLRIEMDAPVDVYMYCAKENGQVRVDVGSGASASDKIETILIDNCDSATGWTAISGAANIAASVQHIFGTNSIEYDKVAGNVFGGIQKTLSAAVDVSMFDFDDFVIAGLQLSSLANIVEARILLGTDASNYHQYAVQVADLVTGWQSLRIRLADVDTVVGNGFNTTGIAWVGLGVEFAAAGNTLNDIRFDHVGLRYSQNVTLSVRDIEIGAVEIKDGATDDRATVSDANTARAVTTHVLSVQQVSAAGTVPPAGDTATTPVFAELTDGTAAVSVANPLNVQIGDGTTQVDVGTAVMTGSVPVTIATDDTMTAAANALLGTIDIDTGNIATATAACQTALEIIDDWDESDRAKVNLIVGQAGVSAGAGAVDATTQRTILASDDPAVVLLGTIDTDTSNIATDSSTIAGDTTSIDGKTPSLGTAVMTGSVPVTLATDDTLTAAANALLGTIDTDTGNIATATAACQTALEIIDDWDDGDKAKTVACATTTDIGADPFFDSDGDATGQALKAGAGNLYKINVINTNASAAYIQLFDVAAGSVVVGTTAPAYVCFVPAEGAVIDDFNPALSFATAISYACTTTATGSGDPAVGLIVSATYK